MMVKQDFDKIIHDFLHFFNIHVENLSYSSNSMVPEVTTSNKKKVLKGLRNIVEEVSSTSSGEQSAIQDEWAEFMQMHVNSLNSFDVLKELNNHLIDKTFFVGNEMGSIDILMYYFLYNIFLNLSFQEKEKYINISRWFDQIQQVSNARLWRSIIPFSRCHLYT